CRRMHSRDTHKRPAQRTEASDVDGEARSDDERPLDVVVDAALPGSRRRIVVSMPARFVRAEERTVQAVVADASDAALTPPPAGPGDGGGH
ncbi:MAG: hypothetical protein M3N49_02845, partial [Candidatus Eremiobacteraeota bacterium]|nr:hypothetical protein [Candidatus Eremiobacteraeota bacterium]